VEEQLEEQKTEAAPEEPAEEDGPPSIFSKMNL
jgi:hypothetical protein